MNVSIENLFENIGRLYIENTYLNKMVAEQRACAAAQIPQPIQSPESDDKE